MSSAFSFVSGFGIRFLSQQLARHRRGRCDGAFLEVGQRRKSDSPTRFRAQSAAGLMPAFGEQFAYHGKNALISDALTLSSKRAFTHFVGGGFGYAVKFPLLAVRTNPRPQFQDARPTGLEIKPGMMKSGESVFGWLPDRKSV